jgi:hypothetical protein
MAQMVSRQPVTVKARVRTRVSPCGMKNRPIAGRSLDTVSPHVSFHEIVYWIVNKFMDRFQFWIKSKTIMATSHEEKHECISVKVTMGNHQPDTPA